MSQPIHIPDCSIQIPIFILRMKSCVYEFIQIGKSEPLIGRTMVTQKMWEEIMGYNPSYYKGDNLPVNNVSYIQIKEFIAKLDELTSEEHCGFRLYYELMSESTYEAVAGKHTNVFGDSDTVINAGLSTGFSGLDICCAENSGNKPREVALTPPNEHGLYDMCGNFWEICYCLRYIENHTSRASAPPKRSDYHDNSSFRSAELRYMLERGGNHSLRCRQPILKGGAWNMPKESCVKETFLEIGENEKFANASFRLTVKIFHPYQIQVL